MAKLSKKEQVYQFNLTNSVSTLLGHGRDELDIERLLSLEEINGKKNPLYIVNPKTFDPPTLREIRKVINRLHADMVKRTDGNMEVWKAKSIMTRQTILQKAMEKGQLQTALQAQDSIDRVIGLSIVEEENPQTKGININITQVQREALQGEILERLNALSAPKPLMIEAEVVNGNHSDVSGND